MTFLTKDRDKYITHLNRSLFYSKNTYFYTFSIQFRLLDNCMVRCDFCLQRCRIVMQKLVMVVFASVETAFASVFPASIAQAAEVKLGAPHHILPVIAVLKSGQSGGLWPLLRHVAQLLSPLDGFTY